MNISIIIPAYNEENRLGHTLKQITTYLENHFDEYEIITVDDCSTDNTIDIISKYQNSNIKILRNKSNRGKGYSIKKGVLCAKYPLVLFSDSDLSTPIEELNKFIKYIHDGYDIVIASRNLKDSIKKVEQPLYRQFMGRTFPFLVNLIVLTGIKDTQCGFKLFKTNVAKKIVELQTIEGFSFDVELLFIAKKFGYKIKEAPVIWIDKIGSKLNPFKDAYIMFIDMFKIRYNNFLGKYKVKSTHNMK